MFSLMLLLAGADPAGLMNRAANRLAAAPAATRDPASRYRVADDDAPGVPLKDRALREDGSKCGMVGSRPCPKRARRVFSTAW